MGGKKIWNPYFEFICPDCKSVCEAGNYELEDDDKTFTRRCPKCGYQDTGIKDAFAEGQATLSENELYRLTPPHIRARDEFIKEELGVINSR